MNAKTRYTLRDSQMSRAARAMFAFLFRNARPMDVSAMRDERDELQTLRRLRARASVGTGLVTATTYLAREPMPRRRRSDRPVPGFRVPAPRSKAS
jgi:hypothetical protein